MPTTQNCQAEERPMRASETIYKAVPEMLRANPRAKHGIHKSDLIVDPPALTTIRSKIPNAALDTHINIKVQCTDTLDAAAKLSERPFAAKRSAPTSEPQLRPNVALLNMASPLRPNRSFLGGANSQEEFLYARTSLYPSLCESFYRLPEVGGIYTPDVLVFRDSTPKANDLMRRDWYFVDVLSTEEFRFPDSCGYSEYRDPLCTYGISYCDNDQELMTRKMKAVMRIAEAKCAERLVIGVWGCNAYGNPVKEVAKIWRKVISGSPRQRIPNAERWNGIQEIVFAVPDRSIVREFKRAFIDILCTEPMTPPMVEPAAEGTEASAPDVMIEDLIIEVVETELQLEQTISPRSRLRIKEALGQLNRDLVCGIANKAAQEEDLTLQVDEEVDGFVLVGFEASDGEDNSFYNFDENDFASGSSDVSEMYKSRPEQFSMISRFGTRGEVGGADAENPRHFYHSIPHFDPQTGWFSGSMDQLARMLCIGHPVVGKGVYDSSPEPSGQLGHDKGTIETYLKRYGGTNDIDDVPALKRPATV